MIIAMKIVLDAMGGDNAPDANIKGAVNAINKVKAEVVLVGKEEVIRSKVKEFYNVERLTVEDIAFARNWIISGGAPDIERTAIYVLRDFREGKIGKFILDIWED